MNEQTTLRTTSRFAASSVPGLADVSFSAAQGGGNVARRRGRSLSAAVLGSFLMASCGGSTGDSAAPEPTPPPTVTSSLKPDMVLTAPLPWIAEVKGSTIAKVEFLIDGKILWTEHHAPYSFNDDGQLLAPWLLAPGVHELTARATNADGQTGDAVVRVTTQSPKALPSGLVGTFTRTLTQADIDRTAQEPGRMKGDPGFPGKWVMHVKDGLLSFDDPMGGGGGEAISANSGTLQMFGSPNWLLPEDRRGGFCDHEPPVSFTWTRVKADLKISGGGNCADRDGVFVGTWRKQ